MVWNNGIVAGGVEQGLHVVVFFLRVIMVYGAKGVGRIVFSVSREASLVSQGGFVANPEVADCGPTREPQAENWRMEGG